MDTIPDQDHERVNAALKLLSEHYDTVTIFVARDEQDKTIEVVKSIGSFFMRYGQVRLWLIRNEARVRYGELNRD